MSTRLRSVVKPRSSGASRWGYAVVTRPRVAAGYRPVAGRAATCVTVGENGEVSDLEHLDVLVVGAGLSGIGAGYRLSTMSPSRTWAILEARDSLGGTWDLFRYPGVRSDSDMMTLGFPFEPWTDPDAIADGPKILDYLRRDRREARHRRADPSGPQGRRGRLVERGGALDGHGRARRRARAADVRLPLPLQRLLRLRAAARPAAARPRVLRGRGRAPAVLARRPRRRRVARSSSSDRAPRR